MTHPFSYYFDSVVEVVLFIGFGTLAIVALEIVFAGRGACPP